MLVSKIEINNAIVIPSISMAAITGKQSASSVLASYWNSRVFCDDTGFCSDVVAITTHGQYSNLHSANPATKRASNLKKVQRFRNQFLAIAEKEQLIDPTIIPHAYSVVTDEELSCHEKHLGFLLQARGHIRNAMTDPKTRLGKAASNLSHSINRELSDEQIAFWAEEFALDFGIATNMITPPTNKRSIRQNEAGPRFTLYPEPLSMAAIEAYRHLEKAMGLSIKEGQAYYVDTSTAEEELIIDMGLAVQQAEPRKSSPFISYN